MHVLSERIKELRNERGLTQKQVAQALSLSQGSLARYESGSRKPGLELLVNLAVFFKVSTDYLLGLTDEKRPLDSAKKMEH